MTNELDVNTKRQWKRIYLLGLFQTRNDVDLICDCRRFRRNDSKTGRPTSNHQLDCHGYSLKKYIEFSAKESMSIYISETREERYQ